MSIQNRSALVIRGAVAAVAVLVAWGLPGSLRGAEMAVPGGFAPGRTVGQTRHGNVSVAQRDSVLDVEVVFAPEDVSLGSGGGFWAASVEGCRAPEELPGHPSLPARFINVLIPNGGRVQGVEADADEVLLARDVLMFPAQVPVPVSTPLVALPAFVPPDAAAYAVATKVPAAVAELAGQHTMRGHSFVSVRINPVRYVPATRELYLATRIRVRLQCAGAGRMFAPGRRGREAFSSAVRQIVVNSEMVNEEPVATGDAAAAASDPQPTGLTDYLIITSNALSSAFQALADHRAARNGFSTAIVSTETIAGAYAGVDIQAKIRACIIEYVRTRGTVYVVLGGDDTVVIDRNCYVAVGSTTQSGMPTDLYYAGLDSTWDEDGDQTYGEAGTAVGNEGDLAPDVFVGRIPVRTALQATTYINKVIQFENNPIASDRMMLLGTHLGINASPAYSPYSGTDRPTDVVTDGYSNFASHSPISDTEMWTRRLYRDTVQKYWQPTTLALFFDTLTTWDIGTSGNYGLNGTNLTTRLNQGWYHVFMMTHGSTASWELEGSSFNTGNATAVTGRLGFIYTGSCQTGRFDDATDPCLSEAFLRDAEGPVAYFGCSREGWYYPNNPPASNWTTGGTSLEYARDFYDQYFRGPHTSLAQVFYAHKTVNAGSCGYNGADRWIMFGMNYQGDPALLAAVATRALTVSVQGQGTVTLNPPGGTYPQGTSVQMTAGSEAPWQFVRWEGDVTGSTNPASVVMNSAKGVTAVFAIPGDIDGDGHVDIVDLLSLADSWDKAVGQEGFNPACDLNNDGSVDVMDLLMLAENWGV